MVDVQACMVAEAEPDVLSSQDMASALGWDLSIQFNNDEDDESTVVTVQGQDQTDLLMSLTGAFNSLNLIVHSARIDSQPGGEFRDVFHISTKANEKVGPCPALYCPFLWMGCMAPALQKRLERCYPQGIWLLLLLDAVL